MEADSTPESAPVCGAKYSVTADSVEELAVNTALLMAQHGWPGFHITNYKKSQTYEIILPGGPELELDNGLVPLEVVVRFKIRPITDAEQRAEDDDNSGVKPVDEYCAMSTNRRLSDGFAMRGGNTAPHLPRYDARSKESLVRWQSGRTPGPLEMKRCECGRIWELLEKKLTVPDPGAIICICGATIRRWNGSLTWTAKLAHGLPRDFEGFDFSGRAETGGDLEYEIETDFWDAALGAIKKLTITRLDACDTCQGTGAVGSAQTCQKCGGCGAIQQGAGDMPFNIPCTRCGSTGKTRRDCPACDGKGRRRRTETIEVRIPAGVSSGSRLRVAEKGNAGAMNGPAGDLYLRVEVKLRP